MDDLEKRADAVLHKLDAQYDDSTQREAAAMIRALLAERRTPSPATVALVEALKETAAILQSAVVAGKVRGGDSYRIGGVYLQNVSDAIDDADAALAAYEKESRNAT